MKFSFIELLILIALVGIFFSVVSDGIDSYKSAHATDSNPVIEFVPK